MEFTETFLPVIESNEVISKLLHEWNLSSLIEDFKQKRIDIEVLKNLTFEDINNLISTEKFGDRIRFRTKLFEWRQLNGFNCVSTVTDTLSLSTLQSWVTETDSAVADQTAAHNFDLQALLNCVQGKHIIQEYKNDGKISKNSRKEICTLICDSWLNSGKDVTSSDYFRAYSEIKKLFPSEEESLYLGGKKQRGKLSERFYALSRKYQQQGILKSRYKLKRKGALLDEEVVHKHQEIETEISDLTELEQKEEQAFLQKNSGPESIIIPKWDKTFNLRRRHVMDRDTLLFNEWPILKHPIGASLIELDFEKLYPGSNKLLFAKWPRFLDKSLEIFKRDVKDAKNKLLVSTLGKQISEDTRNYIHLILLNALLIPSTLKLGGNSKKSQWKPSILDAQESVVSIVKSESEISKTIDCKKKAYSERSLTVQPFIFILTEDIAEFSSIYVAFNDILYSCENFLKAVSLMFQMYQTLNIEYPKESCQMWHFIESYFYDMTPSGKESMSLKELLSELKD